MKGYKNMTKELQCLGFQYEVGKKYTHNGDIKLCKSGFHFHTNPFDLFTYYEFDLNSNTVVEVEASGEIICKKGKSICSEIKIIRVLSNDEIRDILNLRNNSGLRNSGDCNSGLRNSGDYNSGNYNLGNHNAGNWNSGDYNTGYYNSGLRNSGNYNTGNWNSGNWNKANNQNGFFNTRDAEEIMVFNKPCKLPKWEKAIKPKFIFYENNWKDKISKITKEEIGLLKSLPNFDKDIFAEISGLTMTELEYYEILFRNFKNEG